jgi:hypothetical protein
VPQDVVWNAGRGLVTLKDNTFPQLLLLIQFAHDAADNKKV